MAAVALDTDWARLAGPAALGRNLVIGPEQAVRAHQLVRGKVMMPIHWGLFDLAAHSWTEPMERTLAAAAKAKVRVASVPPGGMFEPTRLERLKYWWPRLPWKSVKETPVWSTSVDELLLHTKQSAEKPPPRVQVPKM